jgi:acyl-CoA thioester hydrolase
VDHHETRVTVRLSEVDSFGMVWHGRYWAYCEVGRTDLLRRHGLSAAQLREGGYHPAIVRMECDLLAPAWEEEILIVRTRPVRSDAAKLEIRYDVIREDGRETLARASTTQVLLDGRGVLLYRFPPEIGERIESLLGTFEV